MPNTYFGHAVNPGNTDLDELNQTATNASVTATQAAADAALALTALGIVPTPTEGSVLDTLQAYVNASRTLWVGMFGVVGDGVTDDTVAMQAALTAGATYKRVINGGNAVVKITAPLSMSGPGLVFDQASYGNPGDPGILVSGTLGGGGTPAITISGAPSHVNFAVYGTGQAANAVYFNNPQRATIQQIRAYNFNGYGVKIDKCWDCVFESISVELCGNTAAYAFSMNDGGDTCNQTHIGRLQVEQALTQAIFISPNSLALTIDSIHSERLRSPNVAYYAWILGGASCSYNDGRFTSQGTPANAYLWLRGAWSDYTALRGEGVTTFLEGTSSTGITLVSANLTGNTQEYPAQSGALCFLGGTFGTWVGVTTNRFLFQSAGSYLPLTGGNLTGDLGIGATRIRREVAYKGLSVSAADTSVVGSGGGVVDIADGNTAAICLITNDGGESVIVSLQGGVHAVVVLSTGGGTGAWSAAAGTAASTNIFWNAGTLTYRLQNNTVNNRTYYISKFGAVPTA